MLFPIRLSRVNATYLYILSVY